MPKWIGDGTSDHAEHDPRLAKVVADVERLHGAAQAASAWMEELLANPPAAMSSELRVRLTSFRHLCQLVINQAEQLRRSLAALRNGTGQ